MNIDGAGRQSGRHGVGRLQASIMYVHTILVYTVQYPNQKNKSLYNDPRTIN